MLFRKKRKNIFLSKEYLPPLRFLEPLRCNYKGKTITEYQLPVKAKIRILVDEDNEKIHCVEEPPLSPEEKEELMNHIYRGERPVDRGVVSYYYDKISSSVPPIYPLLLDPNLEDIALNAPFTPIVVVNRLTGTRWLKTNIVLDEENALIVARNLAKKAGKPLSPAYPFAEGVLPEGHRVAVSLGEIISRRGTSFTIRVYNRNPPGLQELVARGMLSPLMASYLWLMGEKQGFIMITGGMATGKTTLLQAILNMFPDDHRVVTIEDTPEMTLALENWDSLVTRMKYYEGGEASEIGLYELAKFALRRRAEHLVIGETRGVEARVLAQAAATGHGSLTTFHADSVRSALYRLMSEPISLKPGFAALIWSFVQLRLVGGARKVSSITETIPRGPNRFSLRRIFVWDAEEKEFQPQTVDEVLERSYRLLRLAENHGYSREELKEEIAGRAEFISSLSKKNLGLSELREYVREYYRLRREEG